MIKVSRVFSPILKDCYFKFKDMYKISNIYDNIYKNLFLESISFSFYNFGILIN